MGGQTDELGKTARLPDEDLALAPPIELGTILFSLVEPHPGHAGDFNLWYERDHYFAGCMAGADFFSGRRFVATRDLKSARVGTGVTDDADLGAGAYLHLYWILKGRRETALEWSVAQVRRLARQKRMGPPTRSVSTGFYDYVGGTFSGAESIPAELALEYPYRTATVLLIDQAEGKEPDAFRSVVDGELSRLANGAPRDMALWFRPLPLPANAPRIAAPVPQAELDRRWLILLFSDATMDEAWRARHDRLASALKAQGIGTLRLAAPFRPIVPGVDDHSDRL